MCGCFVQCQARLAAPLRIELAPKEEEQYDDLDEVVARCVWLCMRVSALALCLIQKDAGRYWMMKWLCTLCLI